MEQAGADALELNIFDVASDPDLSASDLETRYCNIVRAIRKSVRIPIAVKLGPYFTSCANFAKRLADAGADGVVIFNRFYQPDFDLEEMEVTPNLVLSSPHELRLRLHWAAILYHQVETYIAITGGVHDSTDVLKCMMAGAHVSMMTSALLRYGIEHIGVALAGIERWMEEHEYVSIRQMRGSMSMVNIDNPAAFLRGNYLKTLGSVQLARAGNGADVLRLSAVGCQLSQRLRSVVSNGRSSRNAYNGPLSFTTRISRTARATSNIGPHKKLLFRTAKSLSLAFKGTGVHSDCDRNCRAALRTVFEVKTNLFQRCTRFIGANRAALVASDRVSIQ